MENNQQSFTANTGYQNLGTYQNPIPPKNPKNNKKTAAVIAVIAAIVIAAAVTVGLILLGGKPNDKLNNKPTGPSTSAKPQTTEAIQTSESTATELTTEPEGGWAKADINQICQNIEINGKKISFPCTIRELSDALGEEWSYPVEGIEELKTTGDITRLCFYKNFVGDINDFDYDSCILCELQGYKQNIEFEENLIYKIAMPLKGLSSFSMNGITRNTTLEDLKNQYENLSFNHNRYILYDISLESKFIMFNIEPNTSKLEIVTIFNEGK